jgi:coenzyme F420-reducing hydrogenase gamma subunit
MAPHKPTVAVHKFSSCDGCQLSILNLEDELLELASSIDIAYFLEATRATRPGPYDIAIVEGSITTEHEIEKIKQIRDESQTLVALGTCATAGGIQALRNFGDASALASRVYAHPEYLQYLDTATAISAHVRVDLELWGCPVNKSQVLDVIVSLLHNRRPNIPPYSVCLECKRSGVSCVMVAQGTSCLGPATQAGCGAICPGVGRGCYGCFGPLRNANLPALSTILQAKERLPGEAVRMLRSFSGNAPAFRQTADALLARKEIE